MRKFLNSVGVLIAAISICVILCAALVTEHFSFFAFLFSLFCVAYLLDYAIMGTFFKNETEMRRKDILSKYDDELSDSIDLLKDDITEIKTILRK